MPWGTIAALLPVFFVIALGYAAGRTKLVDNQHITGLNTIVMTIALPISLFTILASADRTDVLAHLSVGIIVLIVMAVLYLAVLAVQRFGFREAVAGSAVQALTVAFPNAAAVGLPLADSMLGRTGQLAVAVALAVGSITLSPLTIVLLERSVSPRPGLGRAVVAALAKPVVVAPILGLAYSLSGLPFPDVLDATLSEMGSITGGLALFLTGLVLSAQRMRIGFDAVLSTVGSIVLRPALALLALWVFPLPAAMAAETLLLLALPSGFFGILLGLKYGQTAPAAGTTLMLSTVLSAVTIPLVMMLPT